MLLAGDERWHTQSGNNNTYCQDNDLTWLSWEFDGAAEEVFEFARQAIALRKEQPVLARKYFLTGEPPAEGLPRDVMWWNPAGREMKSSDWEDGYTRCFGMWLPGRGLQEIGRDGHPRQSDSVFLLMNAHYEAVQVRMPALQGERWQLKLATAPFELERKRGSKYLRLAIPARSFALFIAPGHALPAPSPAAAPPATAAEAV
jgi:glycogen operon protein